MATLVWATFLCNCENLDSYARRRGRGPRLPSVRGEKTFLLITLPFVDRFLKNQVLLKAEDVS